MNKKRNPEAQIEPADLLTGIVRSLECAQHFQQNAVSLFREKQKPGAYVLGVIALEHLGQTQWLLERFLDVQRGRPVSWKVLRGPRDHKEMARDGLITLSLNLPKIYQTSHELEELGLVLKKARKKKPSEITRLRFRAQYVRPDDEFDRWTSPLDVPEKEVHDLLLNTGHSYRTLLFHLLEQAKPVADRINDMGLTDALQDPRQIWPPPEGDVQDQQVC